MSVENLSWSGKKLRKSEGVAEPRSTGWGHMPPMFFQYLMLFLNKSNIAPFVFGNSNLQSLNNFDNAPNQIIFCLRHCEAINKTKKNLKKC